MIEIHVAVIWVLCALLLEGIVFAGIVIASLMWHEKREMKMHQKTISEVLEQVALPAAVAKQYRRLEDASTDHEKRLAVVEAKLGITPVKPTEPFGRSIIGQKP